MRTRSRTILLFLLSLLLLGSFFILGWGISSTKNQLYSSVVSFDTSVQTFVNHTTPLPIAHFLLFMTYLANTEIIIGVQVVILIILILVNEELLAAFFLGGLSLGAGLSLYFKSELKRSRPAESLYQITRHGYAFPSGHALISIVLYGFLGYCLVYAARSKWQKAVISLLTILIVFLIGYSRIALEAHFASDVLGGWFLGGALLSLLILLFHVVGKRLELSARIPQGITLVIILLILIALGFFVGYFYVTHVAELRSIGIKGIT